MKLKLDKKNNKAYLYFQTDKKVFSTMDLLEADINIDYDINDNIIGIEFMKATQLKGIELKDIEIETVKVEKRNYGKIIEKKIKNKRAQND